MNRSRSTTGRAHRPGGTPADPRPAFGAEPVVALGGARVAVLGNGSAGSLVAWCLASRGAGCLILADRDRLGPENLRRHTCGHADLGRPKPEALAGFLADRFPGLAVERHALCFLEQPERLRDLIERAEVVVVAVDDEGVKFLIDAMVWELGRPGGDLGGHGGGWGAEAIVVDPARPTPCYGCMASRLGRLGIALPMAPPEPGSAYALPGPGPGPGARPEASDWPRADLGCLMPIAAFGARLTAAVLEARQGADRSLGELTTRAASAWRLALRRVEPWGFGPWHLAPVRARRRPRCPLCGPARLRQRPQDLKRLWEGPGA
jgi:hypothetical protein